MNRNKSIVAVAILTTTSLAALFMIAPSQVLALSGGPDAFGYTYDDTAPYSWITAAGSVVANMPTNCDNVPGANDFLFGGFTFYGVAYNNVMVCPNGFVKFAGALNSGTTANINLPGSGIPNADIIGFGSASLDPTLPGSGMVYFDKQATQSVVTWDNVSLSATYRVQFQIIMKDTGVIDIQYRGIPNGYSSITSGIESQQGDMGLQYSGSVAPGMLRNGTNVRYTPPSPPVADVLTIMGQDFAPASAMQTESVLMERYVMTAGSGAIGLRFFRVQKLGTVADSNVYVRIYNDTNDNSRVDTSTDQLIIGSTSPTAGIVTVTFTTPMIITPTSTQRWLIVVDCQCRALPGDTLGVRISDTIPSATLAGIDTVSYAPAAPIDSSTTTVVAFPTSTLTTSFSGRAPATVMQGEGGVVMLEMNATVDTGSVRLTRVNVTMTGTPPRDADVYRAYLISDSNDDGFYEPLIDKELANAVFNTGVASFFISFRIDAGAANRERILVVFDVSPYAVPGDTIGGSVASAAEMMTDTCNAVIAPGGFPGISSNALVVAGTPNTVSITSWNDRAPATVFTGDSNVVMADFTIAVDTGMARIDNANWLNVTLTGIPPNAMDIGFGPMGQVGLWADMDYDGVLDLGTDLRAAGGWFSGGPVFGWVARMTPFMGPIEIYASSPRNFILTYQISTTAMVGDTVGVRIDNVTSARFQTLTVLSPVNLPAQSFDSLIQMNASDVLTMDMTNLAPLTAAPFETGVVMGTVGLSVPSGLGSNYVEIRGISINRVGTSSDQDVSAVGVYHDVDDDSLLDPLTDQFLGASSFSGGMSWITFDPMFGWNGLRVQGGTTESILLVIDLSPVATPLATIGLTISSPTNVNIDTMTSDSVSPINFPLATGLLVVRGIAAIPTIFSPWTLSPPSIDGQFSPGEWSDALQVDPRTVMGNRLSNFMFLKNDATNLYIAYDVVGDHTADFEDSAAIAFDTGNDAVATEGMEHIFSVGGWSESYQNHRIYNATTATWVVEDAPFESSLPNHATLDLQRSFTQTPLEAMSHPVIEFQVPLAILGAVPGDTLGFASGSPAGASQAGVSDSWGFGYFASWPFAFGPMMGSPALEEYGNLVLGKPPVADVIVTWIDRAPFVVVQGQTDVAMANLTMEANIPMATFDAINVTATGTGVDSDIAGVKFFDDMNDNGILDAAIDVQLGATATFSGGSASFTGLAKNIIMGTPERFLIIYDFSAAATSGATIGAQVTGASDIVLAGGNSVAGVFPMQSWNSRVNTPPTAAGLTVNGFAALTADILHIVTPPGDPPLAWSYADGDGDPQSEYKVQVWTGPSGSGVLMWDPPAGVGAATSVNYNGAALVDGATYYFRVQVFDGVQWCSWAEVESRINTPPQAPAFPISPPDDAIIPASPAQTMTWDTAFDAEGDPITYAWEVEENGTCTYASIMASGVGPSNVSGAFVTNISSAYCWHVGSSDGWEPSGWSADWNFTTSAILNTPPMLGVPSVAPLIGSTTTLFAYSVRYSDADNEAPVPGNPLLWIEKAGVPITGSPFAMTPGAWVGAPDDFAAGRDYDFGLTLPAMGLDYTFYFTASDPWGASDSTAPIDAPDIINTAPTLNWLGIGNYVTDGLDVELGTTSTLFTFRVMYSDLDNDAPASIDVLIEKPSGTAWGTLPLAWESWIGAPGDYVAGAVYNASTTLAPSGLDYAYSFSASDGTDWATGAPTIAIDAPDVDDPPMANARVWPMTNGFRDSVFVFDAANSTDDLGLSAWQWEFGDGFTSNVERISHTYASLGTFTVNLTIWDLSGQSDMDTFTVTVANQLPIAQASVSPASSGYVTTVFTFDATGSTDSDGSISSYSWNFGDGDGDTGAIVTHTYSSKQSFGVTLTVTDSDGATDLTSLTIYVVNREPVITSRTPSFAVANLKTGVSQAFSVVASDADYDVLSYSWTVNIMPVGTNSPLHSFQSSTIGSFVIMVMVTDGIDSVSSTWAVTVTPGDAAAGFPLLWVLLSIVIIVVVVVISVVLVILLGKRKKERRGQQGGPMLQQPPMQGTLPPQQGTSQFPPPSPPLQPPPSPPPPRTP
jgi:hypothetical protein